MAKGTPLKHRMSYLCSHPCIAPPRVSNKSHMVVGSYETLQDQTPQLPRLRLRAHLLQNPPQDFVTRSFLWLLEWDLLLPDAFCIGCSLFLKISPWLIPSPPSPLLKISFTKKSTLKSLFKMHPQPHSLHDLPYIFFFPHSCLISNLLIHSSSGLSTPGARFTSARSLPF